MGEEQHKLEKKWPTREFSRENGRQNSFAWMDVARDPTHRVAHDKTRREIDKTEKNHVIFELFNLKQSLFNSTGQWALTAAAAAMSKFAFIK